MTALLRLHLTCAFAATLTFWVAAAALKGGSLHRRAGRWFARLAYATAVTGAAMALSALFRLTASAAPPVGSALTPSEFAAVERQTMWLVLYVLLILVAPVQHGLAVVRAAATPARIRSRTHGTLNIASMIGSVALLPAALIWERWLFLIVVPIGFVVGLRNMAYASRATSTPPAWRREHLTSMITAGISLHTALFVFETSRALHWQLGGWTALLPWTLPALIGLPIMLWLRRGE